MNNVALMKIDQYLILFILLFSFLDVECHANKSGAFDSFPFLRYSVGNSDSLKEIYVSLKGDDENSGIKAFPLKTLEAARDLARKIEGDHKIIVWVKEGTYILKDTFKLSSLDSRDNNVTMEYRAWPGEKVVLSGGTSISSDVFEKVKTPEVLSRIAAVARDHVIQVDLHALSIMDLGMYPKKYVGVPVVPELFFNDQRMTVARWPNEGWSTVNKIMASGSHPRSGDKGLDGGIIKYSGERPARWDIDTGVWLHGFWAYDWYSEVIRIDNIDLNKSSITLASPAQYSVMNGNPSPRRFYALNLIEELDSPGEYFIDNTSGSLYFWPPDRLHGSNIVLSTLKGPVISIKDTSNIIFRGFVIEASLGNGIEITGGNNIYLQACDVRNIRQFGIKVTGGLAHRVEACDIHDTGMGGLVLSGGDRKKLTPSKHKAINNHIWNYSRLRHTDSYAIALKGVGNYVAHNLFHDAPHQAIVVEGNDNIFEYNIVHHVCMECDDCGAYYKGRDPSSRGNIIRYNFWHSIGSKMGHGTSAIYLDDGDGGDSIFGNIFYRSGDPGIGSFGSIFSHGGHDIIANNNIFIESGRALGSSPWSDKTWHEQVHGRLHNKLYKDVDVTRPPYSSRYPELLRSLAPMDKQKRINRAAQNLFVNCDNISNGNWQALSSDNWTTDDDPFVHISEDVLRLQPDSKIFSRLAGFKPIPFIDMGLVENDLRPDTGTIDMGALKSSTFLFPRDLRK